MKNNLLLGTVFTLIATVSYAFETSIVKLMAVHVPVPVMVFVQSVLALVLIIPIICWQSGVRSLNPITRSNRKPLHLLRTIVSLAIAYLLYAAIKRIPYFDSILLYNTFPLFIPFIGLVILRGKIKHAIWPFVLMGFAGVWLTLHVDHNIFSWPAVFAIGSAICACLSIVYTRKLSSTESGVTMMYYYFLLSTIISGLISIPFWHGLVIPHAYFLIVIGVTFFLVQLGIVLGATYTTPVVVANLFYTNMLFSLVFAHFLLKEHLSEMMLVGMCLIVCGGFGVLAVQHRQQKRRVAHD